MYTYCYRINVHLNIYYICINNVHLWSQIFIQTKTVAQSIHNETEWFERNLFVGQEPISQKNLMRSLYFEVVWRDFQSQNLEPHNSTVSKLKKIIGQLMCIFFSWTTKNFGNFRGIWDINWSSHKISQLKLQKSLDDSIIPIM